MKISKLLFIVATLPVLSFAGGIPRGPVNPEPCQCPQPFMPIQPSPILLRNKVNTIKFVKPKNIKKSNEIIAKKHS